MTFTVINDTKAHKRIEIPEYKKIKINKHNKLLFPLFTVQTPVVLSVFHLAAAKYLDNTIVVWFEFSGYVLSS